MVELLLALLALGRAGRGHGSNMGLGTQPYKANYLELEFHVWILGLTKFRHGAADKFESRHAASRGEGKRSFDCTNTKVPKNIILGRICEPRALCVATHVAIGSL